MNINFYREIRYMIYFTFLLFVKHMKSEVNNIKKMVQLVYFNFFQYAPNIKYELFADLKTHTVSTLANILDIDQPEQN